MPDLSNPIPIPQMTPQDMTILQAFLANLGYGPGPNDGLWGTKTQAAWLKFAKDNGQDHQVMTAELWGAIDAGITDRYTPGPGVTIIDEFGSDGGTGLTIANSPGVSTSGAGDGVLDADEIEAIRDQFPSLAYLLDDPEIGPLLELAVAERWPPGKLSAKIEGTEWFQRTNESQRTFDSTLNRDPATAQRMVDQQAIALENTFAAYGIQISNQELQDLAMRVLRDGLDQNQTLRIVGNYARQMAKGETDQLGGQLEGNLGSTVQVLQRLSTDYFLNYTDDELEEMAIKIMEGRWSMESAQATMVKQAAEWYPHLKDRLEEGLTVKDYYAPTRNRLASLLNMNPNDIDLTQSRWAPVTQLVDDGNGNMRNWNFNEINTFARNQDEFWQSDQAASEGYGMAHDLLSVFGAI